MPGVLSATCLVCRKENVEVITSRWLGGVTVYAALLAMTHLPVAHTTAAHGSWAKPVKLGLSRKIEFQSVGHRAHTRSADEDRRTTDASKLSRGDRKFSEPGRLRRSDKKQSHRADDREDARPREQPSHENASQPTASARCRTPERLYEAPRGPLDRHVPFARYAAARPTPNLGDRQRQGRRTFDDEKYPKF